MSNPEDPPGKHQRRLRRLAEARVGDLGMTLTRFQAEHRIGRELWRRWRDGAEDIKPTNDRRVHAALKWAPESRQKILTGGDPVPLATHASETGADDPVETRWIELHRRLDQLPEHAQRHTMEAVSAILDALEAAESGSNGNGEANA